MNRKMYWKPSIEDIQNEGCDELEVEALCDIFERCMKRTAISLARKACFNMADFEYACRAAVDDFTLTVEKSTQAGAEQWVGLFEAKGKTLRLLGTLEPAS